jgi:hypothetical protein
VDLGDIYLVTDRLETASATDVTRAERELGCRFPTGYAEYVQRLGRGSLNGFVRVMVPGQIVAVLADWRATWHEYWFWDDPESAADQHHISGAVPVADTYSGDELWFHPEDPDTVIVLPRDSDRSYAVGSGLDGPLTGSSRPECCWNPAAVGWRSSPTLVGSTSAVNHRALTLRQSAMRFWHWVCMPSYTNFTTSTTFCTSRPSKDVWC